MKVDLLGVALWVTVIGLAVSAVVDPLPWPFSAVYLAFPVLVMVLMLHSSRGES